MILFFRWLVRLDYFIFSFSFPFFSCSNKIEYQVANQSYKSDCGDKKAEVEPALREEFQNQLHIVWAVGILRT